MNPIIFPFFDYPYLIQTVVFCQAVRTTFLPWHLPKYWQNVQAELIYFQCQHFIVSYSFHQCQMSYQLPPFNTNGILIRKSFNVGWFPDGSVKQDYISFVFLASHYHHSHFPEILRVSLLVKIFCQLIIYILKFSLSVYRLKSSHDLV